MAISQNCHLIVVTGGKGGVGKSVLAANLAASLLTEMRARTLLIDLDSKSCGDQNVITGMRPVKTVGELCQYKGAITPKTIGSIVAQHQSGLHFLGAVHSPDQNLSAARDLFRKQLYALSQLYKFIVVDIGTELGDLQMSMIEVASAIVMVSTPEVLVVNQTRKKISELMQATVPRGLIQVVINRAGKNSLNPQSIGQSLGSPVLSVVPQDDNTAFASLQRSTPFVLSAPNSPLTNAYREVARKLTGGVLQRLKAMSRPSNIKGASSPATAGPPALSGKAPKGIHSKREDYDVTTLLKMQIHSALIKEMDLKKDLTKTKGDPEKEKELRQKTMAVISQLTDRMGQGLSREERSSVIKQVLDESLGLGPLEELLADPQVTEIMVNGAKKIYMEKSGKLTLSPITFTSNQQLRNVIERIMTPLGRRIDEKTPYQDARLMDGSRVNAIIEPLAIDGPSVTIRKFPEERITVEDYVQRFGSLTQAMADFLKVCVEQGLNIIISGGTGSGKTTLLNVMSGFIPVNERIVTVEDAAELQLKQDHVVRLETRPANMEGTGAVTIRDLVKNSLRMRPDRIVVGECRDGAALDMLSAMNTGHDGSMTTVHSNSPREAVSRLETLCMMAGMDLPARAIREQIAGAVDLVVQIGRLSDGSRKVKSITEIVGMTGDKVTQQEIFRYKETGFDKNRKIIGQFQAMGRIPTFIEKFEKRGVVIPRNLFTTNTEPQTPAPSKAPASKPAPAGGSAPPPVQKPTIGSRVRSAVTSSRPVTRTGTGTKKTGTGGDE